MAHDVGGPQVRVDAKTVAALLSQQVRGLLEPIADVTVVELGHAVTRRFARISSKRRARISSGERTRHFQWLKNCTFSGQYDAQTPDD
jgi:hypothetical protein